MKFMRRPSVRVLLGSCLLAAFVSMNGEGATAYAPSEQPVVAPKPGKLTYAHIRIKGSYPEAAGSDGLFGTMTERLADALARLDKAANDKDISGVVLQIKEPTIGWAKLNEFRKA